MIKKIYLYLFSLSGILISTLSGYFSVIGFMLIFKSIAFSIAALAILLEISKVFISIYLHLYFKKENILLITYLLLALIILMGINSLGVYSYLSKGYIESFNSQEVSFNIEMNGEEIKLKEEEIKSKDKIKKEKEEDKKKLKNELYLLNDEEKNKQKIKIEKLTNEIEKLANEANEIQKNILEIKKENNGNKKEIGKIDQELGPIKYLSLLLYSSEDKDIIDKSMRIFIVILILVFDPLAIISLIASISALEKLPKHKKEKTIVLEKENIIEKKEEKVQPIENIPIIENKEIILENNVVPIKEEKPIQSKVNVINTTNNNVDRLDKLYSGEIVS